MVHIIYLLKILLIGYREGCERHIPQEQLYYSKEHVNVNVALASVVQAQMSSHTNSIIFMLIFHHVRNPVIKIGFYNISRVICTIFFI